MSKLTGKTVWITGAGSGIGAAIALACSERKANVVLSGRNEEALNKIAGECAQKGAQTMVLALDLTKIHEFIPKAEAVKNQFGGIDYLVNNGGISQRGLSYETDLTVSRKIMEVNFFGTIALTNVVVAQMRRQQSGHLTVISSLAGKLGFPLRSSYSASKHALQGYFETIRPELAPEGIQVLIASPGRIKTDISKSALLKDGTAYGEMDPGQQKGMPVDKCAAKIVRAMEKGRKDILVGRFELGLFYIRKWMPWLYHFIVKRINPK